MLKQEAAKARDDLERLIASPPKNWGHFPLKRSVDFKRDMASVQRLLARQNAPAEKLRAAYHMISAYYIDSGGSSSAAPI